MCDTAYVPLPWNCFIGDFWITNEGYSHVSICIVTMFQNRIDLCVAIICCNALFAFLIVAQLFYESRPFCVTWIISALFGTKYVFLLLCLGNFVFERQQL